MIPTGDRRRYILRWGMWLSLAIPMAVVSIYLLIWYGPDVIARHDIGNVTGSLRVLRLQQARDAARGRLLTLGAGLFAAGALIYTARNFGLARGQQELSRQTIDLSRRTIEATEQAQRRTLELTEQGQVTDRYTKAIEQLGHEKLDVRIGGIYALERISRDSARDHPTVMEVLAAFIREHSPEQPPIPESNDGPVNERAPRPDVQAALTVIGRRDATHHIRPIDLVGANLTGAGLGGAHLGGADFHDANLTGADLTHADLTHADLTHADLTHANLHDANLHDAILSGANLTGANLDDADLGSAKLDSANLGGANLGGANLIGARLVGARLYNTNLTYANFTGADLDDADLGRAYLYHTNLNGANLTGTRLGGARLEGVDFTDAYWPQESPGPEGWVSDPDSGQLRRANADDTGN